jgi:hypothetical protein
MTKRKYGPGIIIGVMPMPDPKTGWGYDPGAPHKGCAVAAFILAAIPCVGLLVGAYWIAT